MKVVFFGSPAFAVPFLSNLVADPEIEVVGVVAQPDKPAGRGHALRPPATILAALEHGLPIFQPPTLKSEETQETLRALGAEAFVVVAYGKLIPAEVLRIPPHGCINVHPSLLPKHRGPSPMQWTILQGDAIAGVSIMLLDEGMDTGPILAQHEIPLGSDDTYLDLEKKVTEYAPKWLSDALKDFVQGKIYPVEQDESKASSTRLLTKEDGKIDWTLGSGEILRRFRAFYAWPGSWTLWNGRRVMLTEMTDGPKTKQAPGSVWAENQRLFVACGQNSIEVLSLKLEGGNVAAASAVIAGHQDLQGAVFS